MTDTTSRPKLYLSDEEVDGICEGLTNNAAKARWLRQEYGLTVMRKPNGRPLVLRDHAAAILSGQEQAEAHAASQEQAICAPNRAGLIALFKKEKVA